MYTHSYAQQLQHFRVATYYDQIQACNHFLSLGAWIKYEGMYALDK